jgi:hypothetical protein
MARPKGEAKALLHISIPVETREALDNILFDPIEGRVPVGAYARFIAERVDEYTTWDSMPLEQYGFEETDFVSGPKNTILKLAHMFNKALERNR